MSKVRKAVFPAAGIGSRFLPITKTAPKEMLPLVDRPIIQYVVEEALAAGIEQIILVTNYTKRAVEDYFDTNYELEMRLEQSHKFDALHLVRNIIPPGVDVVYVRQPQPLGLGDAVLRAKSVVGDEPFAVLLADDIIQHQGKNCLQQMLDIYAQTKSSVLAVESVPDSETHQYGIVAVNNAVELKILDMIEKPGLGQAPSNLAVVGRYVLTPDIFDLLAATQKGAGGEIQLTDAIRMQLKRRDVHACLFVGERYDCGSRLGFVKATIAHALQREDLGQALRAYLNSI
ncbi:MAG: UTP--glucose-1-phosphate uridylyltransferase [Gammaproteobacteria bacterium RIFCSPHIGHO2_12_FULL_41_15]|nr:MAG: UTP--glucose-1-phosphate uridylyltransferase [Gammaproteobacteria bacterium RIFCSPHIGHO2_12_FULL_41_15]